ncbi:hypothetical protein D3C80_1575500 [compost metagenome]
MASICCPIKKNLEFPQCEWEDEYRLSGLSFGVLSQHVTLSSRQACPYPIIWGWQLQIDAIFPELEPASKVIQWMLRFHNPDEVVIADPNTFELGAF